MKALHAELVGVNVHAESWEEAIRYGGNLLVQAEMVEPRYVEAMIDNIKKLGPYVVIAPGVAMPHARPEDGVLKKGISFVHLREPVAFGKNAEQHVNLVICLGATDSSSHLDLLQDIAEVMGNVTTLNRLKEVKSVDEVLHYFQKGEA